MSRMCNFCGKTSIKAANRSHSNVKTIRRQSPNLQKLAGFLVCTRCRRSAVKKAEQMMNA